MPTDGLHLSVGEADCDKFSLLFFQRQCEHIQLHAAHAFMGAALKSTTHKSAVGFTFSIRKLLSSASTQLDLQLFHVLLYVMKEKKEDDKMKNNFKNGIEIYEERKKKISFSAISF